MSDDWEAIANDNLCNVFLTLRLDGLKATLPYANSGVWPRIDSTISQR